MKGGGVPPEPTPQTWLDSLPLLTREAPENGYAIYTGSVNGVTNLVYYIEESVVHYLRLTGSTAIWRFDLDSGEFVAEEISGSGWVAKFINGAGLSATPSSAAVRVSAITKEMVTHRSVPL